MSSAASTPSAGQPKPSGGAQEDCRVVVPLPYAISNMVFIQAAPLWLLFITSVVGHGAAIFFHLAGKTSDDTYELWIASAVCTLLAVAGLLILRYVLWRPALRGGSSAIVALYVLYAIGIVLGPLLILPMVAFVFLPVLLDSASAGWVTIAALGLPIVICGILWLLAVMNLFEKEVWTFARLNGRCPVCQQWPFGRVRRPAIIRCAHCGSVLEFVRTR